LPEGEHKGIDYNRVLQELPEDAQKLLANMRSSFTKKTQELAEQRKALQSQMEALSKSGFTEKLNEVADRQTELDPYDPKSFENKIQEEVARRMREMVQPLEEQYQLDQMRMKYERFKSENPDLLQPEIKTGVKKLLDENPALDLPTAYKLVKADVIIRQQARPNIRTFRTS
jgi:Skp family chaperone for outer membrane proteins